MIVGGSIEWSEANETRLRALAADGLSAAQIAAAFGCEGARNAIIGKCARMGLQLAWSVGRPAAGAFKPAKIAASIEMPTWVPSALRGEYERRARQYGEESAAAWARQVKRGMAGNRGPTPSVTKAHTAPPPHSPARLSAAAVAQPAVDRMEARTSEREPLSRMPSARPEAATQSVVLDRGSRSEKDALHEGDGGECRSGAESSPPQSGETDSRSLEPAPLSSLARFFFPAIPPITAVPLLGLISKHLCRWPVAEDERGIVSLYCGDAAGAPSPYCAAHRDRRRGG